jgi:hypothetical protein
VFDPDQAFARGGWSGSIFSGCGAVHARHEANGQRASRGDGMTELHRTAVAVIALVAALFMSLGPALAVDLNGAWATNADECGKVFRKSNANEITFAPDSEMNGGGFIVEHDQLRGRSAKCTIKARKDDGATVNIVASCATEVMFSTTQFAIKVINQNQITRLFPGMDDIQINYYRCPM